MTLRVRSGLLAGVAGLLASALGAVVCCAFSPFVALLAGGAAGFFAARAEEAPTQREGILAGVKSGAIVSPLILVGHLIGTVGQGRLPQTRAPMKKNMIECL